MPDKLIVAFADSNKIVFGGTAAGGLVEIGVADDVGKASAEMFGRAMGSRSTLVAVLDTSVGKMANRPGKVELEFSASLTAKCDLWIVAGDGKGEFKVKLTWG